jgi:hypothetical protein
MVQPLGLDCLPGPHARRGGSWPPMRSSLDPDLADALATLRRAGLHP